MQSVSHALESDSSYNYWHLPHLPNSLCISHKWDLLPVLKSKIYTVQNYGRFSDLNASQLFAAPNTPKFEYNWIFHTEL